MEVKFLDLQANYQSIKSEVNEAIQNVLDKNNYILGTEVEEFERNFAKFCGVKHCIGVANGTDALEIALKSLSLDTSAEVIVPGNTYVATCLGVIHNSYKLVLCDCNPDTYQINLEDLKNKVNEKTKVLIIVHLYGLISNMEEICNFCTDHNITLIEDAAQSHGAEWNGKKAGSFGKLACFSFYPGKNLGAYGDGGAICTNDKELNDKIRMIRNNGSIIKYKHDIIGRNSRLDTIQAAILDIKLKYLSDNNKKRRNIAEIYNKNLPDKIKKPFVIKNSIPVFHLYVIQSEFRDELQDYLKENLVSTLIHYPIPCSQLKALDKYCNDKPYNCINLSNKILSLPMYPELEEEKALHVCNLIKQFYISKSQIDKLKSFKTQNKGGILNCMNSINFKFNTKRVFYIDNFNKNEPARGNHANKTCNEILFVTNGSIKVKLISQNKEEKTYYLNKNNILFIPCMKWLQFWSFQNNSSICVLCDEEFESDGKKSIFDFNEFTKSS